MSVTTLLDGTDALEILKTAEKAGRPYSLAILDLQMPFISGFDLAAAIRTADLANPQLPLLAYTSSTEKIAASCKDGGFTAFLTKPARRNILLQTLSRMLGNQAIATSPQSNQSSSPSTRCGRTSNTPSACSWPRTIRSIRNSR